MTVWLDTLTKNVCDPKSFQIPVWVGDLYFADSVVGFTMTVYYDVSNVNLEDIVVTSSGTMARKANVVQVTKDAEHGVLYIQAGDTTLTGYMTGHAQPLLILVGNVTAPDTVAGLNGWVQVNKVVFESTTMFDPITYNSGFVHVVRDTTAAYTGSMGVTTAAFDTLRIDTVSVTVGNLKARQVDEISFSLKAAPGYYSFIDTLQAGTLADAPVWSLKDVTITPDSIAGRFVSQSPISSDGPLLKVRLRRETDSAFDQSLHVTSFEVNRNSCLGKLMREDGEVTAAAIIKEPPSSVAEDRAKRERSIRLLPNASDGSMVIVAEDFDIEEAKLFDRTGRQIALSSSEPISASMLRIRTAEPMASGIYFLVLRSGQEIVYKQFSIIK
jgi:hypothetical protein